MESINSHTTPRVVTSSLDQITYKTALYTTNFFGQKKPHPDMPRVKAEILKTLKSGTREARQKIFDLAKENGYEPELSKFLREEVEYLHDYVLYDLNTGGCDLYRSADTASTDNKGKVGSSAGVVTTTQAKTISQPIRTAPPAPKVSQVASPVVQGSVSIKSFKEQISSDDTPDSDIVRSFIEKNPVLANSIFAEFRQAGKDINLTAVDFNGMNISGINFNRAIMTDANLSGVTASGTSFEYCKLDDVNLSGGIFTNASFRGSVWDNVEADKAKFYDVNFSLAKLQDVDFFGCVMERPNMTGATLVSMCFSGGGHYESVDFTGATMRGIGFVDVSFDSSIWKPKSVENLRFQSFTFVPKQAAGSGPSVTKIKLIDGNTSSVSPSKSFASAFARLSGVQSPIKA